MPKLTIDTLQQCVPDVTLYLIEADRTHYAFLGGPGLSEDRLHDLFLGCPEEGWQKYFESTWYPLAHADTQLDAIGLLETKIRTVRCEDIAKYIAVLMAHSDYINDNFNAGLEDTLEAAAAEVDRVMKLTYA
ncbi:hypothetical protein D3C84_720420 [compost metagenome]